MTASAALLQDAVAVVDAASTVRDAAAALRARFAGLRVVVVDAFDMRGETPAASGARWALYLGASDGQCWSVTADPARAAGFFLAPRS